MGCTYGRKRETTATPDLGPICSAIRKPLCKRRNPPSCALFKFDPAPFFSLCHPLLAARRRRSRSSFRQAQPRRTLFFSSLNIQNGQSSSHWRCVEEVADGCRSLLSNLLNLLKSSRWVFFSLDRSAWEEGGEGFCWLLWVWEKGKTARHVEKGWENAILRRTRHVRVEQGSTFGLWSTTDITRHTPTNPTSTSRRSHPLCPHPLLSSHGIPHHGLDLKKTVLEIPRRKRCNWRKQKQSNQQNPSPHPSLRMINHRHSC